MQLRRLPLVVFKSSVPVHTPPAASWLLAGVVVAALASGCAYGNVRQVLRAQFASDVGCSDVTLKKRDFWYVSDNPHQYKISGCGVMRTYTCTKEDAESLVSYDEPACKWEEGDSDAPKPKIQEMPPDDAMDEGMGDEPMDEGMGDEPMDEPAGESESELDADADADLDTEGAAPKGKVKAKAKGGLRLGSD